MVITGGFRVTGHMAAVRLSSRAYRGTAVVSCALCNQKSDTPENESDRIEKSERKVINIHTFRHNKCKVGFSIEVVVCRRVISLFALSYC